jgi:hypothetical protein
MFLTTIGHATLSLSERRDSAPLLLTDPWILGSCYWRSWWLERYPSPEQIERARSAAHVYLTHEHPDHFHTPSIRRIGKGPLYLVPELTRDAMGGYLREHGFRASTLPAGVWTPLSAEVRVLSVPTVGNDSMLLIDTPHALIANANDARPSPDQLLLLRRARRAVSGAKRCVLLASYSSAGISSSLYRNGRRLDFAGGDRHARYVMLLARALDADSYIPFASHVRFERPDTRWANAFRVSVHDVRKVLTREGIDVLPPYVTLNLTTFEHSSEAATPARSEPGMEERVRAQLASEALALDTDDLQKLEQKLNAAGRLWLPALFPRGIAFELPSQRVRYDSLSGRAHESLQPASVVLRLPAQAVKDVLASGYFSDLCIPMFTEVHLGPETLPQAVYLFFVMMQLHDVGATGNAHKLRLSLARSLAERGRLWRAGVRERAL